MAAATSWGDDLTVLPGDTFTFARMGAPDGVDERRVTMGLGPARDALAGMSRHVCGR